jgi:fructose-1,6-bisphosphatase/inositol monophosphatase family enzyme
MVGTKTTFNMKTVKTNNATTNLKIAATTPYMFNDQEFKKFTKVVKTLITVKNWGGDAYNYGLLASGFIDVVIESDLKIYDIAALVPIVEGAGGIITT